MEDTNWRLLIGGYWLVATNWRHQVRCYRFGSHSVFTSIKNSCNVCGIFFPGLTFFYGLIGLSELTIRRPEVGDYVRKLRVELEFQGMITQKWAEKNFGGQGL